MSSRIEKHTSGSDIALKIEHVAKSFRLPTEQASGLKQAIINWTRGIKGYREQQVLRDVNFEVNKGDFFGIVGRNGSGKSTLLKLISKIYVPDKGKITVNGKLVPFIELGVGFNPELTGRENVYLNGALLGFSRDEIDAMYDDIVDFAELEDFMDQKLKNYSSGMQVRLAFSVAIKAQGDILVLDEVLAVGDEAFQRKCNDFFTEIKKDPNKTVILVTHSMESVKKYCNKAILIKDGDVVVNGDKDDVANRYTLENFNTEKHGSAEQSKDTYPTGLNAKVPHLKVVPRSNQVCTSNDDFRFDIEYECNESQDFYLAIALHDIKRGGISFDSGDRVFKMTKRGASKAEFSLPLGLFNSGQFRIVVSLRVPAKNDPKLTDMIAFTSDENSCTFAISNGDAEDYALISTRAMQITRLDQ